MAKNLKKIPAVKKLLEHPLKQHIKFDPVKHQYWYYPSGDFRKTKEVEQWKGITSLIGEYKQPFDRDGISKGVAFRDGKTQKEVLAEWDIKRDDAIDYGNALHEALDQLVNDGVYSAPWTNELDAMIQTWDMLGLRPVCGEYVIYDKDLKRSSPIDIILLNQKDQLVFGDYKTPAKGIEFEGYKGNTMLHPFHKHQDSNYNHYSLQLEIYKDFGRRWDLDVAEESFIFYIRDGESIPYPPKDMSKEWKQLRNEIVK